MTLYMIQCQLNGRLKEYRTGLAERVQERFPDAKVIPSTHVTLEYQFSTNDPHRLQEKIEQATRTLSQSEALVHGIGGFPFDVVYFATLLPPSILNFRKDASKTYESLIERQSTFGGASYTPHVTIARVDDHGMYDELKEFAREDFKNTHSNGIRSTIDNITLISQPQDASGIWCVERTFTIGAQRSPAKARR